MDGNSLFPSAKQLRTDGRNYLIILNEVMSIQNAILLASDSGLLDAQVYNTYMTNITIPDFQNVTTITLPSTITKNSHGLQSGDAVQLTTTGTLPSPLSLSQTYFAIVIDINTFQLAASYLDTVNNIPIVMTDSGSGTMGFRAITPAQQYWDTWQGNIVNRPLIEQMNGVLSHFKNLGYNIKRVTNPDTNITFRWVLAW